MLGRLVGRLVESALIDPLEALESELGDVVWDLPGDALDRLIWWRSTQAWCWC